MVLKTGSRGSRGCEASGASLRSICARPNHESRMALGDSRLAWLVAASVDRVQTHDLLEEPSSTLTWSWSWKEESNHALESRCNHES